MSDNVVPFKPRKGERGNRDNILEAPFRWLATISYPSGEGRTLTFDEFADLGELMERGSDWTGAIIEIKHYEAAEQSA